ncbi:hypothetical protein ISS07_00840 [Candidatus Woesearchaeota archaeon]|nr:hypothetical protein [Candidatus Woesearchaeota archaeon]
MSQEISDKVLSIEEVEKSVAREGVEHPLLTILDELTPQFQKYFAERPETNEPSTANDYIKNNLGFFAEAIDQTADYNLEPLDLIAIWSKAEEIGMSRYDTTEMSGMIAAKYAAQGLKDPAWKNMASKNLKSSDLSSDALNRSDDVVVFRSRLEQVSASVDALDEYRSADGSASVSDVIAYMNTPGNTIEGWKAQAKEKSTQPHEEFLGRITENFGNGMTVLYMNTSK